MLKKITINAASLRQGRINKGETKKKIDSKNNHVLSNGFTLTELAKQRRSNLSSCSQISTEPSTPIPNGRIDLQVPLLERNLNNPFECVGSTVNNKQSLGRNGESSHQNQRLEVSKSKHNQRVSICSDQQDETISGFYSRQNKLIVDSEFLLAEKQMQQNKLPTIKLSQNSNHIAGKNEITSICQLLQEYSKGIDHSKHSHIRQTQCFLSYQQVVQLVAAILEHILQASQNKRNLSNSMNTIGHYKKLKQSLANKIWSDMQGVTYLGVPYKNIIGYLEIISPLLRLQTIQRLLYESNGLSRAFYKSYSQQMPNNCPETYLMIGGRNTPLINRQLQLIRSPETDKYIQQTIKLLLLQSLKTQDLNRTLGANIQYYQNGNCQAYNGHQLDNDTHLTEQAGAFLPHLKISSHIRQRNGSKHAIWTIQEIVDEFDEIERQECQQ